MRGRRSSLPNQGTGGHIISRLTLEDILNGKQHYAALPTKATGAGLQDPGKPLTWHGLRIELFPAGDQEAHRLAR